MNKSSGPRYPEMSSTFLPDGEMTGGFPPVPPGDFDCNAWALGAIVNEQLPELSPGNRPPIGRKLNPDLRTMSVDVDWTLNEVRRLKGGNLFAGRQTVNALSKLFPGIKVLTREEDVTGEEVVDLPPVIVQAQLSRGEWGRELALELAEKYQISFDPSQPFGCQSGEVTRSLIERALKEVATQEGIDDGLRKGGAKIDSGGKLARTIARLRLDNLREVPLVKASRSPIPAPLASGIHEIPHVVSDMAELAGNIAGNVAALAAAELFADAAIGLMFGEQTLRERLKNWVNGE